MIIVLVVHPAHLLEPYDAIHTLMVVSLIIRNRESTLLGRDDTGAFAAAFGRMEDHT